MTDTRLVVDGDRLTCEGPVTYYSVSDLHRELLQAIAASQAASLELDLSAAEDMDSSAIALLVAARMAAEGKSITIRFTGLDAQLESLARLYGVDELISG